MAENAEARVEGDGEPEEGAEGGGGGGKIALIIVTLLGLGAGGVVGSTTLGGTVGPILAEKAQASGGGGGGDHDAAGGGAGSIVLIDNLVVNPAQSQGRRFLLTSVAIELHDPEQVEVVSGRDVAIRDALILVLGVKTVEELTDITLRKQIVQEIHDAIAGVIGADLINAIYIPQFVIQ